MLMEDGVGLRESVSIDGGESVLRSETLLQAEIEAEMGKKLSRGRHWLENVHRFGHE